MKIVRSTRWRLSFSQLFCTLACLFPSLLLAHPGHYHPDETDEFDMFRATFFHSHGSMDYLIAAIAIIGIAVTCMSVKPAIRISALAAACGALALLPIL